MKCSEWMKWLVGIGLVALAVSVVFFSGCDITREMVVDNPGGIPVERIVVEGPGGDLVPVGHEIVTRIAPLLPEPWNTIMTALAGAFTVVCGNWVWRKKKKNA